MYILKSANKNILDAVLTVPGTVAKGDGIAVPAQVVDFARAVAEHAAKGVQHLATIKKGYGVTDDDRTMLQMLTGDDDIMDKVTVYRVEAANTLLDKENERFTPGVLTIAANQVQKSANIPVLFNHNSDALIGRVFDAYVEQVPGADGQFRLMSKMYILNSALLPNGTGMSVTEAVNAGILNMTSIGIMVDNSQWKELGDGRYERILDGTPDGTHYLEQSLVWHGAQVGAMIKGIDKTESIATFEIKPVQDMAELTIKGMKVTVTGEEVTGVDTVEAFIDGLTAEVERLEGVVKEMKRPFVDEALTLHKGIGTFTEKTEEGLFELSVEGLNEHLVSLRKAANPGNPMEPKAEPKPIQKKYV